MVVTYPLMFAIQEISARIGRTTGKGIATNIREHYPSGLLRSLVVVLLLANIINIGADLAAMGDALKLLIGGPALIYVIVFGVGCVAAQILLDYDTYVRFLKWSCLSLFAYVAALATVKVPWLQALKGLLIPSITWSTDYFTTLVAIAGTTISPYLFSGRRRWRLRTSRPCLSASHCFGGAGKLQTPLREFVPIPRSGWRSRM